MKISWINDAGIRAETSQGLILFNHDESTLNESSQKDENTIAIFLDENLKKNSEKKLLELYHPNSLNDGVYNTMLSLSDNSNEMLSVKGLRMLKSKKGAYITFDCKAYFERNENFFHILLYISSGKENMVVSFRPRTDL